MTQKLKFLILSYFLTIIIDDLIVFADTVTEKLNKYFNVTPDLAIVTIILDPRKKKKLTTLKKPPPTGRKWKMNIQNTKMPMLQILTIIQTFGGKAMKKNIQ